MIRKSFQQTAQTAASQAGFDPTRFTRTVEREKDRFFVEYHRRPSRKRQAILDGSFRITLDAKTGKVIGPISHL